LGSGLGKARRTIILPTVSDFANQPNHGLTASLRRKQSSFVLEKFSVLLFKLRIATYKKTGSGLVQHFAGRFRGVEKIKNHIVIEPSVQIKFGWHHYIS